MNNKKVIIVDDNNMMLKVATKLLSRYNIVPDTKSTAKEVLKILKSNKYDLIIADDMMPEMSGIEMMKTLKNDPNFNTPIVVLTGNTEISNPKEYYLNAGFDDFLEKPLLIPELEKVLNKYLSQ